MSVNDQILQWHVSVFITERAVLHLLTRSPRGPFAPPGPCGTKVIQSDQKHGADGLSLLLQQHFFQNYPHTKAGHRF